MAQQADKMYRVYTIVERPKQDDYWLNSGAAFPHEDGKGYNIIMKATTIGAKTVRRLYEPKECQRNDNEEAPAKKKAYQLCAPRARETLYAGGSHPLLYLPRPKRPGNPAWTAIAQEKRDAKASHIRKGLCPQ